MTLEVVYSEEVEKFAYFTTVAKKLSTVYRYGSGGPSRSNKVEVGSLDKDVQFLERTRKYEEELNKLLLVLFSESIQELNSRFKLRINRQPFAIQKLGASIEIDITKVPEEPLYQKLMWPNRVPTFLESKQGYASHKRNVKFATKTALIFSLLLLTGDIHYRVKEEYKLEDIQ